MRSKRILDVAGATIGLIVSAPVIAVACALVKLESPHAPVIYKQVRIGKDEQTFVMYKIRSMHPNDGDAWTLAEDPRRLRIGKFIRKFNIDEMPQFLNVLKGEMSLVGPRPITADYLDKLTNQFRLYSKRHNVRPGMTGLSQVSGCRGGGTCLRRRYILDLLYTRKQTILLDLRIMLATTFSLGS